MTVGASCIGKWLKYSVLKLLNVGRNPMGNDGISLIMQGLQDNQTLTALNIQDCGFSVKGTVYICYVQVTPTSLYHSM